MTVIVAGGDGDGIAIGGNHFLHAARRNTDLTYVMMDNEIYGLTKGQAAPTTPIGDKTKSTTYGNPEAAVDPCALAISFGATWVGRGFSGDVKGTAELMKKAIDHRGFSFLNIISPCVTWRGDNQTKELRAKVSSLPHDYDPSSREGALRFTSEEDVLTVGVLYAVQHSTLIDEIEEIRGKAAQKPASRQAMLAAFA
jgi:2-oxoglutarate ferredoxin oxidoreductase subunit beta